MRGQEHGGIARFRYSDLNEAARFAADAGVMQIQLRKSRFGGAAFHRLTSNGLLRLKNSVYNLAFTGV